MEHPGVVAGNFATFWAFLCTSKAPSSRSLWSRHHWKGLFLLQKMSVDDANFGQKWWRQKRKKDQGSSWAVTGINGLRLFTLYPKQIVHFENICFKARMCSSSAQLPQVTTFHHQATRITYLSELPRQATSFWDLTYRCKQSYNDYSKLHVAVCGLSLHQGST